MRERRRFAAGRDVLLAERYQLVLEIEAPADACSWICERFGRLMQASATLVLPAAKRVRGLGRSGVAGGAFLGLLLGAGYALQTAGLERTTVSSTRVGSAK